MNDAWEGIDGIIGCDEAVERLPLRVAGVYRQGAPGGRAAQLDAHLSICATCSDELAFLQFLDAARPTPPADLAVRVVARALGAAPEEGGSLTTMDPDVLSLRSRRSRQGVSRASRWWANPAAAAAVLVLAVGMGLVARGGTSGPEAGTVLAAFDAQSAETWAEDWLVAGAPYLDGVSDETLALLAAGIDP